ncbi:MAG: trehalose-phosphatase [Deltaproteobacteria bacterium]|nr:trehalose-phosphatase [Deltaproteobacteria bacterium]MBW2071759.1 trehalose-phosphatase [Deltaproteobacteria bacterium]
MQVLNPDADLKLFHQRKQQASENALFLDYDGTLAPFQVEAAKAQPYPGVRPMLNRIIQIPNTRLVVVSGRWTKDLLPLLQLEAQPEIWGSHGLERLRGDGSYEIAPLPENVLEGLVAAHDWIVTVSLAKRCEKKPGSLALHWRGLSEKEIAALRKKVEPKWSMIAEAWGLALKEFDGGLELRAPARNKGDAVRTVLQEMSQDVVAAYLGDDVTDEDAFEAVKGKGIAVLVRPQLRPTMADLWLKPPEELLQFLADWL